MLITRPSGDILNVEITDGPGRPLLLLPAFGTPAGYYARFVAPLAENGFQVATMDWRGHGKSTPKISRASRYGYREHVGDIGATLDALGWTGDVTLAGHSFGAQLSLVYAARTADPRVARIVPIASGIPHWSAYPGRRRYEVLLGSQAMFAVSQVRGFWPGWGFGGVQSRGTIADWAACARTGRYPSWDDVDTEDAFGRLKLPVLAIDVEGDTLTPPMTVTPLLDKLRAAQVTRIEYRRDEAGGDLDHFRWVRHGRALAAHLATFATG